MRVWIEGSIGVGKSTLIQLLSENGYVTEFEAVEHWTLLPHLYHNPTPEIKALFEIEVLCSLASRSESAQITERSVGSTMGVFVPLLVEPQHMDLI